MLAEKYNFTFILTQAWLDSESDYRLKTQKAQDAAQGSNYAAQKYEKWAVCSRQYLTLPSVWRLKMAFI